MKKLIAVLLIAGMLSTAAAEGADFLGVWYMFEMQEDGESHSPADFGMSMSLELKEDGTVRADYVMGSETESDEGSWALDGDAIVVTIQGTPMTFTLQDGQLISRDDEMSMSFGREPVEVEIYAPAEPVAAGEADFEGSWTAIKYGMDGVYYNTAVFGMSINAEFKDGSLLMTGIYGSSRPYPMTFADGAYTFSTEDDGEAFSAIGLQKLADGNLMLTLTTGSVIVLILAPADAAAEEPAA